MEQEERRYPWAIEMILVILILAFLLIAACVIVPFLWFMDIGKERGERSAGDFLKALFDPGESVPKQKSSYDQ